MNKVILIGNLTKDVELRTTSDGTEVASFTIAVNEKDNATFINCVAWRNTAKFLSQYAPKGTKVGVDGKLSVRNYDGKNGKVYVTEVLVESVELLSAKKVEQTPEQEKEDTSLEYQDDDLPF